VPPYTRLGEVLAGAFNDILRHAGIQIGIDKLNDLRHRCESLGTHLENVVHNKAVETTKKLQEAVLKGFESYEDELDEIKKRLDKLEKK
jgi:hypothetical protein